MKIGDLVKWVGGSYHALQGIIVDTRDIRDLGPHLEVKVIWETRGLGSLTQKPGGSWQRAACIKVISRVEPEDANR